MEKIRQLFLYSGAAVRHSHVSDADDRLTASVHANLPLLSREGDLKLRFSEHRGQNGTLPVTAVAGIRNVFAVRAVHVCVVL